MRSLICVAAAPRQWRSPRRGARRVGEPTSLKPNIKSFCAAAPRQWRSPRRGARRAGEPTPLQLSIK